MTRDNYFTGIPLAKTMLQRKLTIVGTMKKCKREIPECIKHAKSRETKTSIFGFNDQLTMVSYVHQKKRSCDTVKYDTPRNKHWRRRPQKKTRDHQVLQQDEDRCWRSWSNREFKIPNFAATFQELLSVLSTILFLCFIQILSNKISKALLTCNHKATIKQQGKKKKNCKKIVFRVKITCKSNRGQNNPCYALTWVFSCMRSRVNGRLFRKKIKLYLNYNSFY